MRKVLFFLFAIMLLSGCSSDDDDIFTISFLADELKEIEGVELGKYFISTDPATEQIRYAIYVPYTDMDKTISHACNAVCPNEKYPHMAGDYIRLIPNSDGYFCPQCHAMYSLTDGAPLNTEAGSFRLQVYDITYNSKTKMFHLIPK
ncbi:MAG: lipoprotein [Prevotella sp.]|jgi:nitrite reductase/ring-hydroxylating ferredoxin subunit|nr:lipoprotein [Prevotella sp.]